ncbi:MAG: putative signal transducing protein [Pyrinomonadaceae bacterium]
MSKELQTIATTYEVFEAEFLRNHLEAEGFEVYLADDNIIGVFNLLAPAVGGIKIRVPEAEAEDAQIFVEKLRNAEIIYEEDFEEE